MSAAACQDRFIKKTKNENGCWIWKAQIFPTGYGSFYLNGKSILAHRASYLLFKGEIPNGMCICHKCDNPSCVNPDHLFLGTHKDNALDRSSKGRHGQTPKISHIEMEEVFNLYQNGYSQRELAKKYNLSQRSIFRYIRKKIPSKSLKGEGNNKTNLSNQDVINIRNMYVPYRMSCQKIANKYGLHVGTVDRIIRRETWAHV
ncbi:MAG: HNH endonuclease [Chloroherpetonaceae bacterium]